MILQQNINEVSRIFVMSALIPLEKWNITKFEGRYTPNTLRAWARNGCITPPAQKVGRDWLVQSDATFQKPQRTIRIPQAVDFNVEPVDTVVMAILGK